MVREKGKLPSNRQSRLDEQKVREAVAALLAFHKKREESKEASQELLLNESSQIKIIIALWKIIGTKAKTLQIKVPHPLRTPESEVCLFTKDDNMIDSEATARHYQELLQEKGVTEVNEVMPLQVLKKEYKAFESRRQLAKRYDIFLADERIIRLMHAHLGKEFYRRKKYPVAVNLTKKDLKGEILKAIDATYFILTNRGNTNHLPAAHTGMTLDQVVENIMAAIQNVTARIPLGWSNIKALYVRTDESVSLPIHTSLVFKEWETKPNIVSQDIWRLKKQLEVTGDPSPKGKPLLPTPEQDARSKRFTKRSARKAVAKQPAEASPKSDDAARQKRAMKRKAPQVEQEAKDVVTPAKDTVKEKPKKAMSLRKGSVTKKTTPGKPPAKSFSAKKAKRK